MLPPSTVPNIPGPPVPGSEAENIALPPPAITTAPEEENVVRAVMRPPVREIAVQPPKPVFRPRLAGPGPIGGREGTPLAKARTAFQAGLRDMARAAGLAADAYEWPNTALLAEDDASDLWISLTGLRHWRGEDDDGDPFHEDAPRVTHEMRFVFGPPPYYFLKTWRSEETGPPPMVRYPGRRAKGYRRATVDPMYAAQRPGPNYNHFSGQLYDQAGRQYCFGVENSRGGPVLYYKRPRACRCAHPTPGDELVLRHAHNGVARGACAGHVAVVDSTRIMPGAATGMVRLTDPMVARLCN